MKAGIWILTALAVLAFVAGPVVSAKRAGKADRKAKAKATKVADDPFGGKEKQGPKDKKAGEGPFGEKGASAGFGSDLEQLNTVVGLTEIQKKKLAKLKEARDKNVERYDAANEPKIRKAEERLQKLGGSKDDSRAGDARRRLEAFIKQAPAGRERLVLSYDRKMFAVLKPEQRAKWNTPILKEEVMKDFSLLFLEAKQEKKIDSLCAAQAKRLNIPLDPEKHGKSLDGFKRQIYRTVLNKKQKAQYRKMKAPLDSKGKGTGSKRAKRGK